MPYIKKLVMHGFKSFAPKTEIILDRAMNCIVGPNGSGKSNVTDAICFVLGRLSIKSMRAAKAANLIFAGTKQYKPAQEASVEMIFDNSDKVFSLDANEVSIKRIVKRNGQGIYRINGQTKTRQEVLELLAQAGIDPHGFNLVLQGEIAGFVKMHTEERRKIIEEVAGISVYEIRKQKSLRELEKTDERLKEVNAILRERTSYLKNLEEERQQALRFKKLQETIKKCRASILKRRLDEKLKSKEEIDEEIAKKNKEADKIRILIGKIQEEIQGMNKKIEEMNSQIQKSSGFQQDSIHSEISLLKQEIAGLTVKKENFESQVQEIARRKQELHKNIETAETEINEMRKTKGKSRKQDLGKKELELEQIEEQRKKFYSFKSSFSLTEQRLEDKKTELHRIESESDIVFKRIEELEASLKFKDTLEKHKQTLALLKSNLEKNKKETLNNEKIILSAEKSIAVSEKQIEELEKIKKQVSNLDTCPLCKTKITSEHIGHIEKESNEKIQALKKNIEYSESEKNKSWELKENLIIKAKETSSEIDERERDIFKIENLEERKNYFKSIKENIEQIKKEISEIQGKKESIEKNISKYKNLEQAYDSLKLEVDEIRRHEEADVGMEITLKQRELDRTKLIIKQISREKEEIEQSIGEIGSELEEKESMAEERESQEEEMQKKFKKLFEEKNKLQDKIREQETEILKKQNSLRNVENEINDFKIKIAEIKAQLEGIETEFAEFKDTEIIKIPMPQLQEKMEKTQQIVNNIGNVNLKALEVYEGVKKEYDEIAVKVEHLQKEKEEILKIIQEIDTKKKKAFKKTLSEINTLFSRNFAELSTKGEAFLEPENPEDYFSGGLDIVIKVAKGKYFDVTSLSGGEQTLIALSLIFAIQEHRPYCFYIFDEIDAALDKRNSERLSVLLKKHMKAGQYIIVTHNDALITESTTLYGVSMQEGISKVLSLDI